MPQFVFRGRNPDGADCTERVEAPDLARARFTLEVRGYREIEFYSDENLPLIERALGSQTQVADDDDDLWTAEDEVDCYRRKGFWAKLWWSFRQHLAILGPLLLVNVLSVRSGSLAWYDWAGFAATWLYLVYFALLAAPSLVFDQLLEASVWRDWKAVRFWIAVARAMRSVTRTGIPEIELQIRSAYADAAEGKLDVALAKMEQVRKNPNLAEPLYLGRLASVYEHARDYATMLRLTELAAEKGIGGVSEWLDVANARLRRANDVEGAKLALAKTEGKEMPILAAVLHERCLGLIALEDGRYAEARQHFEKATAALQQHLGNPLVQEWIWETNAFLVLALSAMGEKAEARRIFRGIVRWLEATKEEQLLDRCLQALA